MIKKDENKKKEKKISDGRTVGVKSRGCVRSLCVSWRSADSLREWKRRIGCRRGVGGGADYDWLFFLLRRSSAVREVEQHLVF